MHRTEHRDRQCRTLRHSAPLRLFSPVTGLTLPGATRTAIDQGRTLVAAFRSPGLAAPFEASNPEVNVPGLLLRFLPLACTARSGLRSATESGWPRTDGHFNAHTPLQHVACGSIGCSPDFELPLRTVTSLRINARTGLAATRPAFRICPIPSRSPVLLLLLVSAPDHRSWFATFPEARCSSNLLEPSSLCSRNFRASKGIRVLKSLFNNIYYGYF
jgi:hypothetical protein